MRLWILVLIWSVIGLASPSAQAPSRSTPPPTQAIGDVLFELVTTLAVDRVRPRTAAQWQELSQRLGLQRKDEDVWALQSDRGELRVVVTPPSGSKSTYRIALFPASSESVPNAILEHLLKSARYTSIRGDVLEIGIEGVETLDGGGSVSRIIDIEIPGGRLRTTYVTIEWK